MYKIEFHEYLDPHTARKVITGVFQVAITNRISLDIFAKAKNVNLLTNEIKCEIENRLLEELKKVVAEGFSR